MARPQQARADILPVVPLGTKPQYTLQFAYATSRQQKFMCRVGDGWRTEPQALDRNTRRRGRTDGRPRSGKKRPPTGSGGLQVTRRLRRKAGLEKSEHALHQRQLRAYDAIASALLTR